MTKNQFDNIKINSPESNIGIGSQITQNHLIVKVDSLSKDLISLLRDTDLSPTKKEELSKAVEMIYQEINSGKPRKSVIQRFFKSVSATVDVLNKSALLAETYSKWTELIKPYLS